MQLALFQELEVEQPPVLETRAKKANKKVASNFEMVERIDDEVMWVLERSTTENGVLYLPEQLERSLYVKVDDMLKRLRGKWNTRAKGHIFPFGQEVLGPLVVSMLDSGRMPEKNPLAYFPSPEPVVSELLSEMTEHLDWWTHYRTRLDLEPIRILEPSAGTGGIADEIWLRWPDVQIDTVEIDEINVGILKSKGYEPHHGDFMEFETDVKYDFIVMNPPFSTRGDSQAYMNHIKKAYGHLRPGGKLVSVAPPAFTWHSDEVSKEFFNWVCLEGYWWNLPDESFKASGTNIKICAISVTYDPWWDEKRKRPYYGWPNFDHWLLQLHADNWYEYHQFENRMVNALCSGAMPLNLIGLPARESTLKVWRNWYKKVMREANKMGDGFCIENLDIDYMIRHTIENHLLEL